MTRDQTVTQPANHTTTFGHLLRQVRRRAGMTQTDLAAAVAYSVSFISSLEKGDRLPDVDEPQEGCDPGNDADSNSQ